MNRKYKILFLLICLLIYSADLSFAQGLHSFVQQENVKVAGITTDSLLYTLSDMQKQTTRSYYDGLGRMVQNVGVQASPLQNDLIQPVAYDNLGRQTISYLSYAGKSTDTLGSYRPNAISTDQPAFYNQTAQYLIATDVAPYTQQVFENSPLQRLLSSGMVGTGFQPVSGQHYKTVTYRPNNSTSDGNILIWNPDGTYTSGTYYANNTLGVTDGKTEDNNETQTFTDLAGRMVLKRQILSTGNLDTYYVYNMAGMLVYTIPPLATAKLAANSYNLTTAPLSQLIFHMVYDNRGRIVEKTVPAKGVAYIVYDPMNRPVLGQDSDMRVSNVWRYIKYDVKGRVVNTGNIADVTHTTRSVMQTYVNGLASGYATTWFESRIPGGTFNYYTENVFPTAAASPSPLTFSYYDDYDPDNNGTANFSYSNQGLGETGATTAQVKGMPTISLVRNIGSGIAGGQWLTKVFFYDKRGNPIQVKSANHIYYQGLFITTDISTSVPDFVGVPQITKVSKQTAAATTVTVQTNLTYDHMYRIKSVDQYYNGGAVTHVASYTYNELGQVIKKGLGYVNATTWLQNVDMRYNIRGQLLSINNSKLSNDSGVTNGDTNDLFGITMLYDKTDANLSNTPSYSGRLSAVKWMSSNGSGGTSMERAFKYYYDQIGRDTAAIYAERLAASTTSFTTTHGWDEDRITYDQNGNIQTMYRNATTQGSGSHAAIDNLTYTYNASNPNQLASVSDASGINQGFMGGTGTYTYDGNGNLTNEPYKGLSAIAYNTFNKTDKISFTSSANRYIDYTYDSGGTLLRKRQFDNVGGVATLQNTTDYIDGFVYVTAGAGTPTLQYFPMPEGRVVNSSGTLIPTYTISDQQGNVRVEFDNTGTGGAVHLRQENSYYAYGLIMPGSVVATPTNPNKTLYNGGSEWQNDFSNLPDYYMTFNRNYDAALGRFIGVDPMAESAESMTSYHYAGNNPIMFNDPLGNLERPAPEGGNNQVIVHLHNGVEDQLNSDMSEWEDDAEAWGESAGGTDGGGGGGGWNSLMSALDGSQGPTAQAAATAARDQAGQNAGATDYTYANQLTNTAFSAAITASLNTGGTATISSNAQGITINTVTADYSTKDSAGLPGSDFTEKTINANQGGGATVYNESDKFGHTYIEVNGTVFSYGRYAGGSAPSSGEADPVGPGILQKLPHQWAVDRMGKNPTTVYQFPNANADQIYNYLNDLYNCGVPNQKGPGMVIGTYILYFNDCTTLTTQALQQGGVNIPTINAPFQFHNYETLPSWLK